MAPSSAPTPACATRARWPPTARPAARPAYGHRGAWWGRRTARSSTAWRSTRTARSRRRSVGCPWPRTWPQALLAADPRLFDDPRPHRDEHSLEMQLPFLQHLVPELRIVPLLMGSQTRSEVSALAGALVARPARQGARCCSPPATCRHYHPAAVANRLDALVVEDVERFDPEALMDRIERNHEHACGGGPMVAVMKAARALGADRATVLRYADSGDVGERTRAAWWATCPRRSRHEGRHGSRPRNDEGSEPRWPVPRRPAAPGPARGARGAPGRGPAAGPLLFPGCAPPGEPSSRSTRAEESCAAASGSCGPTRPWGRR